MRRFLPVLAGLTCLAASPALADDARRRDGTPVAGMLKWEGDRLRFSAAGRDEPLGDLEVIRRPKLAAPARECGWVLHLVGGDSFPVHPLELTEKELRVRTPWADELRVPRSAVDRMTQWPGRQVVATDWKAGQSVRVEATRGWLALRAPFMKTATRRLTLELGFVRDGKPAPVSVDLSAPASRIDVTAPDPADAAGKLNRDGQVHRLAIAFDGDGLQLSIDGYVLWSRDRGPGVLREVKLTASGDGAEVVRVDQVVLWREAPAAKVTPSLQPLRDRIVTTEDAEVYGSLTKWDATGPTLKIPDKATAVPWATVRECTFADLSGAEHSTTGEHVALTLQAGDQPAGRLTGQVTSWGDKAIELDHPRLGALTIPSALVTEVRPLFHGLRLVVDAKPRHLGARDVAGFRGVKPQGMAVTFPVECESAAAPVDVVIDARGPRTPGVLAVLFNGEAAGTIPVAGDEWAPYRLTLPAGVKRLRNELEIRWEPSPKAGDVEIHGVRLEVSLK